ncbi:MAG: amidase, partial [Planctomycetota bacterium]
DFLKVAASVTAGLGAGLAMGTAQAQEPHSRRRQGELPQQPPPPAPPNHVPPAIQFQAAPGGTGAFVEGRDAGSGTVNPAGAATSAAAGAMPRVLPWKGAVPASEEDIAFLPVHRLAALIQARKLSPVKLTEIYLKRLARHDKTLLFVVTLLADSARKEAAAAKKEIDGGRYRGPLHGIPYGIKDLFAAKGAPTTWGAEPFAGRVIDSDATVVERLREAGAILCAKLSTGALARGDQWFRGRTNNPWNPERGSSGSSAGPASATVAGCVGFAIGTETLGSIVSPTRRCGLSALRPTFGRVSRHGCMMLSYSMDKVGPICRTVEDCALVFAAMHGADPRDPSTLTAPFRFERKPDLSKLRIGYDPRADKAFVNKLRELGADPKQIGQRPSSSSRGGRSGGRRGGGSRRSGVMSILAVESAMAFDDFLAQKLDEKMVVKTRVRGWREARKVSAVDYLNAQRRRWELMQAMASFMADWDLYVSFRGDLGLTNMTGHPTVVLPYTFDERRGQPVCTMLVGNLFADDQLLSVAAAYQQATNWHERRPKLG